MARSLFFYIDLHFIYMTWLSFLVKGGKVSDLSFISFPLPSYKIDIDWPNKRSFHSQSFLFKLNSYVQMTSKNSLNIAKLDTLEIKACIYIKWIQFVL